jgi:hypothetical protein
LFIQHIQTPSGALNIYCLYLPKSGLSSLVADGRRHVAAQWEKRLVDVNVAPLRDEDLAWADMVFISAMVVQEAGAKDVIARAKAMGKRIVAGGPAFTPARALPGRGLFSSSTRPRSRCRPS